LKLVTYHAFVFSALSRVERRLCESLPTL